MPTYNERLEALRKKKVELWEDFKQAVIAFEEAREKKEGWDEELAQLSLVRIEAYHALERLEGERKELVREAHIAALEAVRKIGADRIVSTGCTWREAMEL